MLSGLIVVVHVLTVLWLVSGIVGRDVAYGRAARTDDLARLRWLVELGGYFERTFVRPATFIVLVTGLAATWARGWPVLGFLQGAGVQWPLAALLVYLSIIPVIVFVFLPRGRVFRRAFDAAVAAGQVSPELRAALRDPAVRVGRIYEMLMIAVLVLLMVMRPF